MKISRKTLLGALLCLGPMHLVAADEACPDLKGKSTEDHLEYLRGERSKLAAKCIVSAITYLGAKRYAQSGVVLIQYLGFQDPDSKGQVGKRAMVVYAYPAVDAVQSLGKSVVPELTAVIASPDVSDLVRRNAGWAIFFMYGADNPEGIAVFANAAHAQADPTAANRLMDQARWFADRCLVAARNECQNAVLR